MGWLKVVAAGAKALWDWTKTPWGRATTEVIVERFNRHRDAQEIAAATEVIMVADESPATGSGPLGDALPSTLEGIRDGILSRIRVLTARLPLLPDPGAAVGHLQALAVQLKEIEARLKAARARVAAKAAKS